MEEQITSIRFTKKGLEVLRNHCKKGQTYEDYILSLVKKNKDK